MGKVKRWTLQFLAAMALLAAGALPAAAQNLAVRGWCEAGATPIVTSGLTSTTLAQASYPQCTVTVNITGGGAATIFSDATGTPLANPFTAQTNGQWIFFVATGTYDVVNSGGGLPTPVTYSSINVGTGGGGGGGSTAFNAITTGVNTGATMTVSTGASLGHSGSGVVDASSINGVDISGVPLPGQIPIALTSSTATWQTANPLDCSSAIYAGADFGATWNNCIAAAPVGAVLTFGHFTSPQVMTTAVNVNKGVWNDMAGLEVTQQAGITVSTSAVISAGEFDQAFNGDQITITAPGVGIKNNTIVGDAGTHTGRGVVISGYDDTLETVAVSNHSGNEIDDSGGGLFGNANTIVNSIITYGGGAGISSSGADNVSNTRISYGGSGTGNAILIHNTSFLSQVIVDSTSIYAGNPSAATAVSMTSAGSLTFAHGNIWASGYPAIDAPQGGLLIVTGNSINGGGANGPIINHAIAAGVVTNANNFVVANNIIIAPVPGSDGIDVAAGQGDQVSQNQITLPIQGFGGKCGIKLLTGISGMVDHNSIAITGGATATGDNYGVCLVTVSGAHMDQNMVTENVVTGQSLGNAHDRGYKFDNTANDAAPTFVSTNTFQLNNCVDINICFDRLDATQNAITMYINNLDVATASLFNPANGSTNDMVVEDFPGTTFATLPIAGNGSRIYCSDCTQGIPTAGGGSGAEIFRINGQWAGLGGTLTSWASVSAGTNANAGTFAMSGNVWDATAASHTLPIKSGTAAAKPATCTFTAGSQMEIYAATDSTGGQNLWFCTATNTWTQQLNSGASGATTTLNNLGVTAINAGLFPNAAGTIPFGSNPLPLSNLFVGGTANKSLSFVTSALTTNRTVTSPDANTVLPIANAGTAGQFLTSLSGAGVLGVSSLTYSGNTTELATVTGAVTSGHAAGWDASGNLVDAGTAVTSSSTNTFTNKTLDQEGTGNVLTTVVNAWFDAAGCNNATAAPSFDLPAANAPTANCLTGSNTNQGTLDFSDSANQTGQIKFALPHTWTGAIDITLYWLVTASGGSNAVKWTVATAYSAPAASFDTAFNSAQTITTNVGSNNIVTTSAQSALTLTGSAVDDIMHIKIGRDVTDTFTGTARLLGARLVLRKTGS